MKRRGRRVKAKRSWYRHVLHTWTPDAVGERFRLWQMRWWE